MKVFQPIGNTVALDATTTSTREAITDIGFGSATHEVRVYNPGTTVGYLAFGDDTIAAVKPVDGTPANGIPIAPGASEVFRVPASVTHAAVIMDSGTATFFFTSGDGG